MPPVKSGISELDELTGGFFPGELTIVNGKIHAGQGTFIFAVIKSLIKNNTVKPVLYSHGVRNQKSVNLLAEVLSRKHCTGCVKDLDTKNKAGQIIFSADFVCDSIYLFDSIEYIKIDELCDKVRQCVYEDEQEQTIVFIDNSFCIRVDDDGYRRHYERMTEIMMKLKALAQELSVPIVCLSEVDLSVPRSDLELLRKFKRLFVEYNADSIIYIHNENNKNEESGMFRRELIVAKKTSEEIGRCTFSVPNP